MTDEWSTKAGSAERAHHAGDGEPAAPRQRRMSAQRKQEAVPRSLYKASTRSFDRLRLVTMNPTRGNSSPG